MNRLVAVLKNGVLAFIPAYFLMFALLSCTAEQASPEETVRDYVLLISEGQLEKAKAYCTPAGAAYLDALYAVMAASETLIDTLPVEILEMECIPGDSTAFCQTQENDGFETYEAEYHLQLTPNGWKIDQPPAEGETSTSEEIIDSEERKEN